MSNLVTQAAELIYKMSNDELNQVAEAIKLKRQFIVKQNVRSFTVGDLVQFTGRNGLVTGKIKKIAIKNIVVDCGVRGTWRVPASMLTLAETA
jgi:hypothetical protein